MGGYNYDLAGSLVCDTNMLTDLKGIFSLMLRERIDQWIVEKIIGAKLRPGMEIILKIPVEQKSEVINHGINFISM